MAVCRADQLHHEAPVLSCVSMTDESVGRLWKVGDHVECDRQRRGTTTTVAECSAVEVPSGVEYTRGMSVRVSVLVCFRAAWDRLAVSLQG